MALRAVDRLSVTSDEGWGFYQDTTRRFTGVYHEADGKRMSIGIGFERTTSGSFRIILRAEDWRWDSSHGLGESIPEAHRPVVVRRVRKALQLLGNAVDDEGFRASAGIRDSDSVQVPEEPATILLSDSELRYSRGGRLMILPVDLRPGGVVAGKVQGMAWQAGVGRTVAMTMEEQVVAIQEITSWLGHTQRSFLLEKA